MLADVMNGENVGVVERGHGPRLLLEAAQAVRFVGGGFQNNFQSDIAPQSLIPCPIHFSHAPCPHRGQDFVRTNLQPRSQRHGGRNYSVCDPLQSPYALQW
jgi:hypothetical protein